MDVIPFVNLHALHQPLKNEFIRSFEETLEDCDFVRGRATVQFEEEFGKFAGLPHCVGVGNGTDALTIVLRALELPTGSEVITAANTFVATLEAIVNAGLKPVLVDVDPETYLMDPERVEERISPKTKAVLPVHLYGQMADIVKIAQIAENHKVLLIEDAAQAHGARTPEGFTPGQLSMAATYSFFPGKNLGALGDGGAIVTRNPGIASICSKLRNHGGEKKYTHDMIGWNSRLDTIQAKVLLIKLRYLSEWNQHREKVANWYRSELSGLQGIVLPKVRAGAQHVYHLYVVQCESRDELQEYLKNEGIETGRHYPKPVHLLQAFEGLNYSLGDFPVSEKIAEKILSLPMCPTLTEIQVKRVCEKIREFYLGKK